MTGRELGYIAEAHFNGALAGDGDFTRRCHGWLEQYAGCEKALLTHSCTAALEIAALLAGVGPGDEVIMPSYTFVSTANAFVLRGAVPVFVDIRPDTLNIDESLIEAAINEKTKAIVPVHYAGVACEMDAIMDLAERHDLLVIEDAAQAVMSSYDGHPLGSIGHIGAYSFHETKNVVSGEGGALVVNDEHFVERAEILREKGTNRSQFFRGAVDKYSWVDIGSSYLPGEIIAAFLWAQLEEAAAITQRRLDIWQAYDDLFSKHEDRLDFRRPFVPAHCVQNGHMYYLILPSAGVRSNFIRKMSEAGIGCVFHYVPLHSSQAGRKYGKTSGPMDVTDDLSSRLVRLPLWLGVEDKIEEIVQTAMSALSVS
jgi:dTDP-4-amino-4,6-dideoxygalactose transaminase